jgi:hypothetical protein
MADYSKIIAEADGDLPFGDCVSADINYRKELAWLTQQSQRPINTVI